MTQTIANRYRIVREIARSNDIVYEANDEVMGRRLAIKELLIPPNLVGDARRDRVMRFTREAKAVGKLSHPNIVTVFDFGEDAGRYYIAMEYLEGVSLRDMLRTGMPLPVHQVLDITRQVLAGLQHAHGHRVIHRDVKPENIHVLPSGQVKLTDFGIARLTEEASLTSDGQVFGTPSYMSPEQIEGRTIDHRTDIFSLGIVLYEMLSGRKPFTGDGVASITYSIMNSTAPTIYGLPSAVDSALARALNKGPAARWQTAEAMLRSLPDERTASSLTLQQSSTMVHAVPSPMPSAPGAPPAGYLTTSYAPPPFSPPQAAAQAPQAERSGTDSNRGPFASWDQPVPDAARPDCGMPGAARTHAMVSDGTAAFLRAIGWGIVFGSAALVLALMGIRSLEIRRDKAGAESRSSLIAEAEQLYRTGRLDEAADLFRRVLQASPSSAEGLVARTNLAKTLNRQGVVRYEQGAYGTAIESFAAVEHLYQAYPDSQTPEDSAAQTDAKTNLDNVRARFPAATGIDSPPGDLSSPGSEGVDPGTESASPAAREQQAQTFLRQGIDAYNSGETTKARSLWQRAVELAPGAPPGVQAQQYLDQTIGDINFR